MAKTQFTDASVIDFLESFVTSEQKMTDSLTLIELMREWSGFEPQMWGPSIIGFGKYHYKYESGHEGDAPIISFSPRKAALTLYVTVPGKEDDKLLDALGKFKMSKACIYVSKLADINIPVLKKLCMNALKHHGKPKASRK